jgi:hypothetical protein
MQEISLLTTDQGMPSHWPLFNDMSLSVSYYKGEPRFMNYMISNMKKKNGVPSNLGSLSLVSNIIST